MTSVAAVPTISSFTPAIGLAGTSVSITGTNFDAVTPNNRLKINLTQAATNAGTTTSLTAGVPSKTGSGKFTVTTPLGTAVSPSDFFVPPSPFVAADVQYTGRTAFGTAGAVAITTSSRIGLLVFDATSGQRVSIKVTPGPLSTTWMYGPAGTAITSISVGVLTTLIEPQSIAQSGTYSVLVDPTGTGTGTTSVTPYAVPADVTGSITAGDDDGVAVTTTTPGQNGALTFSGTSGHRMSVNVSSGPGGTISLLNPNATTLASATSGAVSAFIEPATLGSTGTHTLRVDPTSANTGTVTLTLYDVPADSTGTVTIGGVASAVSLNTPGQNGTLTFSGTASQQVTVRVTSNTMGTVTVSLKKADGTVLTSSTSVVTNFNLATQTLPATATYTISIDPNKAAKGSMNVSVTNP